MMTIRRSSERGHVERDWLDTYHTFSFASYHDPEHMGFRSLRVLNDDTIAPGRGFGAHAHRDMEIITYVLSGALEHRDSTGEHHIFGPNVIQAMSAGTGVVHSEFNASKTQPLHLLQIWIEPSAEDFPPSYQQFSFDPEEKHGKWRLIAGPQSDPAHPSALIHQDARMYASVVDEGGTVRYTLPAGRHAYVHVAWGDVNLNGQKLHGGDAAAINADRSQPTELAITGGPGGEILLFDLA
jgi:redox-sensitive bicupin YhaK (pirin superfamily)